jgi:methionine-rich copper-binding protein CopC
MRTLMAVIAGLTSLAAPGLAWGHAQLQRAEPAVGATVRSPPPQVEITFSEAVEPRFSTIAVLDAAGNAVDKHDLHASDGKRLAVSLGPVPPGVYRVIWRATSVDTHKTEGSFSFTVAP